jgi:hypothetical protein
VLWGKHKNTRNDALHLWHSRRHDGAPTANPWQARRWGGQYRLGSNSWLARAYHEASRDPVAMRELVDTGCYLSHCD